LRADGETRTPDPIITSDVLYQLSYVGEPWILAVCPTATLTDEGHSQADSRA
jgi:hypothetical protein